MMIRKLMIMRKDCFYNLICKMFRSQNDTVYLGCILLLMLIVFSPTFSNGLQSGWDDQWMVTNRYTSDGFSMENLYGIFSNKYGGQYAPVNQLLYTFLYAIIRYKPVYYHAFCLFLHIMNAIMVFIILKKIYKWDFFNINAKQRICYPLMCSLCFAINPLQVESVAWVSASKITLYAFFYLIGLLFYISYVETGKTSRLIPAFLSFVLSLGSKEQSVVFPLCLLLLHWAHGDFSLLRKQLFGTIPFFLISAVFGMLYLLYASELDGDLQNIARGKNLIERIEIAGYAITVYIRRWFLPIDLQHIYMMPDVIPGWFLVCPICISILVLAYWKRVKPSILFWLLFFLINIGLTLHLIPMGRFVIMADRYMYLPCIAVSNILIMYIGRILDRRIIQLGFVLMIVAWCFVTYSRTQDWKNTEKIRANNSIIVKHFKLN